MVSSQNNTKHIVFNSVGFNERNTRRLKKKSCKLARFLQLLVIAFIGYHIFLTVTGGLDSKDIQNQQKQLQSMNNLTQTYKLELSICRNDLDKLQWSYGQLKKQVQSSNKHHHKQQTKNHQKPSKVKRITKWILNKLNIL